MFEFEDETNESTTLSANVGINHSLSARWSGGISLGQRQTNTIDRTPLPVGIFIDPTDPNSFVSFGFVLVEFERDDSGATYSANINYTGPRTSINLSTSRTTSVNATQGQTISDRARVSVDRRFNARWVGSLGAGVSRSENASGVNSGLNRITTSGQTGVTWAPTARLTVRARVTYTEQEPFDNSAVAESRQITPSLHADWQLSRLWKLSTSYSFSSRNSDTNSSSTRTHTLGLTVIRSWPTMTFSH